MSLLAILANPVREARAAMAPSRGSLSESVSRLVRFSPRARREISSALRTPPLKVDVSGARGEFVRFRLREPKGYQSYALIVLAPKHLRGLTPTEARSKIGQPGFRRLTLGVVGRKGPGKSELQSVLVPKVRVAAVAAKYLKRAVSANKSHRCAENGCRHNHGALPMIAGGMAAGITGAVTQKLLNAGRNPSKSVRTYRVPPGYEEKIASTLRDLFVWAKAMDGHVMTLAKPSIMKKVVAYVCGGKPKAAHNPQSERDAISVPFRHGRKYNLAQVTRWVETNGTPAMKKRLAQALAQYKRFHKGALPRFITYQTYKMGSHPGISDVEFGVSEGREWLAAYQVPRTSGKWADKSSDGRYVHAHGDSEVEVDVKRPVRLSKLPMRFHTPDGKSVGVIPSRNVKIGEWYEG